MLRAAALVLTLIGLITASVGQPLAHATDEQIEALISDTQKMSYRGRAVPDFEYASFKRLQQQAGQNVGSTAFLKLVTLGPRAMPALIRHLTDSRLTDVVMQPDNPRGDALVGLFIFDSRSGPPKELYGDEKGDRLKTYTYKVGDICFSAIGKIVNREFHPVTSLGGGKMLLVGSPTQFPILVELTKKDWAGVTPAEHRQHLIHDATTFDAGNRAEAMEALLHYYPVQGEQTVLKLLSLPIYSSREMSCALEDKFMKTDDTAEWRNLYEQTLALHPPGVATMMAREIVAQRYFSEDPSNELKRSQNLLKTLFPKFEGDVSHSFSALEIDDLAKVLDAVENFPSARIDAAVQEVFRKLVDQSIPINFWEIGPGWSLDRDRLVLQFATRMRGKGFDDDYLTYFRGRLAVVDPKFGPSDYLREILEKMVRQMSASNR
jgi:hypothetical protein